MLFPTREEEEMLRPSSENTVGPLGKRQREEEQGKKVFDDQKSQVAEAGLKKDKKHKS